MAKKRKSSNRRDAPAGPAAIDPRGGRLAPIKSFEDVADSDDEFAIARDKVLLEESPAEKRKRKWQEEDAILEPSDEEVFAYPSEPSEDEDEGYEANDVPPAKRQRGDSDSEGSERQQYDEHAGGWGSSKRDYYNADPIETEADAFEEEAEARRLQQKQLQDMTEADFGFDENEWTEADKVDAGTEQGDNQSSLVVREVLPEPVITADTSADEKLRILRTRYPEFEPLAEEFLRLKSMHCAARLDADAADQVTQVAKNDPPENVDTPVAVVKYQALSMYLGALSMYFALLTSAYETGEGGVLAMSPAKLRDHPVMDTLLKCRLVWDKIKDIKLPDLKEVSELRGDLASKPQSDHQPSTGIPNATSTKDEGATRPVKRSKQQVAVDLARIESAARRAERLAKTERDLEGLSELTRSKPSKSTRLSVPALVRSGGREDAGLGEETHLDPHEAAEKARKKKSLRFYTSQITQKSNKREQAGKDVGGDLDIPHRERLRDRQARLNAQAEQRGKRAARDDGSSRFTRDDDDDDAALDTSNIARGAADDDYYDLIAHRTKARKSAKAAESEAPERVAEEVVGADGKRAISYAIQKNKGLAPKRKKEVRNPRVKKRKRYEDKKKKLSSVRAVYKGSKGAYEGEKTGIKSGLVRSIKL
ncbi:MAG: hypothetical protein M1825_003057 [Sarcosagium campestre]|nr:MAG: hypothetical protein M1825_003057 [Sarcosagium campestre]